MENQTPLTNAVWIAPDAPSESPVMLRRFRSDGGAASLTVTGLGYFEARINGSR